MNHNRMHSRRAFLRGTSAALALPWLESLPAPGKLGCLQHRFAAAAARKPVRLVISVMPNGVLPAAWDPTPSDDGGYLPSFILAALGPRQRDTSVLTGLANRQSFSGDGHYAKVAPLLTGQRIRRTGGRDLRNGISVDQVAAQALGHLTPLASLELGCDPIYPVEDMGYSSVYGGNISWRNADQATGKEIVPALVYRRLFQSAAMAKDATRGSVLDLVLQESKQLAGALAARDRHKLAEFADSLRSLELRLGALAQHAVPAMAADRSPLASLPAGLPADYTTHVELMHELMALALATDSTRVITFLMANEVSGRDFSFVEGCHGGFHDNSHHENDPTKQEVYRRINRWHVQQWARLLDRLAAIDEGHGSVLDHSLVVLAAAMSDGNAHSPHNLPVLLAGRGGGNLPQGKLLASPQDTPLCNLWLSLLQRMGVAATRFGDAKAPLLPPAGA